MRQKTRKTTVRNVERQKYRKTRRQKDRHRSSWFTDQRWTIEQWCYILLRWTCCFVFWLFLVVSPVEDVTMECFWRSRWPSHLFQFNVEYRLELFDIQNSITEGRKKYVTFDVLSTNGPESNPQNEPKCPCAWTKFTYFPVFWFVIPYRNKDFLPLFCLELNLTCMISFNLAPPKNNTSFFKTAGSTWTIFGFRWPLTAHLTAIFKITSIA